MKKIIFLLIPFSFFFACQKNNKPKQFTGDQQFKTTDPSRLYFKNIRSVSYYSSRKANSKIDIYKSRKLAQTDKRPILYPMILDNWLDNEAYLFIEKNAYPQFANPLTIKAARDTTTQIFKIGVFNKKNQYAFAENIYNALNDKQALSVKTKDGVFVPILENYQDKTNFVMTVKDYFKFIEKERKGKK